MARGLAIVATDVGAVSAVVDAANGVLISKLSVCALGEAFQVVTVLPDKELVAMKNQSLSRVGQYTWEQVAGKTSQEIKSVLASLD